jgi:GT2 family glycosyltransferase
MEREDANDVLSVSVVIPTIGRAELLRHCLESISLCRPKPAEIVVVDQGGDDSVSAAVGEFSATGARVVRSEIRNRSSAVNLGMREVAHDAVLITDDDCTVDPSWVQTAWTHLSRDGEAIVTGRVLPVGEVLAIPSLMGLDIPYDYTGELHDDALCGCNMACSRSVFLSFGGFDRRFNRLQDNDFCYRWLRAGRRLHYDPQLLVWHPAWRTPAELEHHFRTYARGKGAFYAKHLRQRDLGMLRFLARDVRRTARGLASQLVHGRSEWPDARRVLAGGVLRGLVEGWSSFGRRTESSHTTEHGRRDGGA